MTYILIWIIIFLLIVIAWTRPQTVEELKQTEENKKNDNIRKNIEKKEKKETINKAQIEFNLKYKIWDCYNVEIPSIWLRSRAVTIWRIEKIEFPYFKIVYRNQVWEVVLWKFHNEDLLIKIHNT